MKSKDNSVQNKFAEIMMKHSDPVMRATAVLYFQLILTQRTDIIQKIIQVLNTDSDKNVRQSAKQVLQALQK